MGQQFSNLPGGIDPGQILNQQQDFIGGLSPQVLSNQFQPTLDQLLQTGAPTNTAGIGQAAQSEGRRFFDEQAANINERLAAQGKIGSSAQTAQLSRALSDTSTRIGEETQRAQVAAAEAASQRRQGALRDAISQGQLGLQSRTQQAGAGQDFINALLTQTRGGGGGGGFRAPRPQGGAGPSSPGRPARPLRNTSSGPGQTQVDPSTRSGNLFRQLLDKRRDQIRGNAALSQGSIGSSAGALRDNIDSRLNSPALMAEIASEVAGLTGNPGQAGRIGGNLINSQAGSVQALNSGTAGAARAAGPVLQGAQQNSFLANLLGQGLPFNQSAFGAGFGNFNPLAFSPQQGFNSLQF